jgi:hypothetical protein
MSKLVAHTVAPRRGRTPIVSKNMDPTEHRRILAMLQHLHCFAELGLGGGLYWTDVHSRVREDLLCDWLDLQKALPQLSAPERQAVMLVGLYQWTEAEVAAHLGITQSAVHQRLWWAARHVLARRAA